ncbi:hypothetical protein BDY17DRAFT_52137 [Neohortaea acidophila]|uniref:Uncharacterized protein n=1 Tax=Neohortaea acidophila TaxID=245834 RepID=A0A6A6PHF4_9PEZI|nr:uncharacterized protein BDY17DRAFT_52137 [Neohortaea acidophila]KAF2479216.1 hypothetical protein BDY17DRAFT_52137 [Neohortaea acidophila]
MESVPSIRGASPAHESLSHPTPGLLQPLEGPGGAWQAFAPSSTAAATDEELGKQHQSPSQRALRRASGTAIIVTPRRARTQAAAASTFRSVPLPQRQASQALSSDGRTEGVYPDASIRTTDLIFRFPAPPSDCARSSRFYHSDCPSTSYADEWNNREDVRSVSRGVRGGDWSRQTVFQQDAPPGTSGPSWASTENEHQRLRALTNGALRFSSHSQRPDAAQLPTQQARCTHHESHFPLIPITITSASGQYCRHRPLNAQTNHYELDGASPPPPLLRTTDEQQQPPLRLTPAQHAANAARRASASTGHRHFINRRINHGTWRTRMKRTKCWRCELESRRNAASEALYRRTRDWKGCLVRFKERLRWSCFCRYTAYDDDSEDEERVRGEQEVEERVRLGRMGGDLT